jgi:hypothetical protein
MLSTLRAVCLLFVEKDPAVPIFATGSPLADTVARKLFSPSSKLFQMDPAFRTVGYAAFAVSFCEALRDRIFTSQGFKVNYVRRVDF